jgi:hypothetical protein
MIREVNQRVKPKLKGYRNFLRYKDDIFNKGQSYKLLWVGARGRKNLLVGTSRLILLLLFLELRGVMAPAGLLSSIPALNYNPKLKNFLPTLRVRLRLQFCRQKVRF